MSTDTVPASQREWLRNSEVTAEYPFTAAQLAQWRQRGVGPAFFRRGKTVIYRRSDIEQWLVANLTTGGSAA